MRSGSLAIFCSALLSVLTMPSAFCFNPLTHDQITRSAMAYLGQKDLKLPTTDAWLAGVDQNALIELLARSAVDEDFRPTIFLDTPYHQPLMGVKLGNVVAMFPGLYHTINVTQPGRYWEYDGFSYSASSHWGNDAYLRIPGLRIRGDLSSSLNGAHPDYPIHGINPGPSHLWFQGTGKDWDRLYLWQRARSTVFPPADVMATVAFKAFYRAERADVSSSEVWDDELPLAKGLFKNVLVSRRYMRAEIERMPRGLDLLGSVFHLAQDQAIPHHVLGTSDFCHAELEDEVDELACGEEQGVARYLYGDFGGPRPECQRLYDPVLVESFRKQWKWMNPVAALSVSERMRDLARVSAEWWWGRASRMKRSVGTELPDGQYFAAKSCEYLVEMQPVRDELKIRYNLAVALTASLFEYAAFQYELGHPRPGTTPESLLNWFQQF